VNLDDRGVNHGVFHVRLLRAGLEKPNENVGFDPVAISLEHGVPLAEEGGQIAPGAACADHPQHRLNEQPIIFAASARVCRFTQAVRCHLRPLGVSQNESFHPKLESQTSSVWNPVSQQALEDCREVIGAAQAARHIVVIGGSFISLEAAASLSDRGCKVSVVAPEEQPMASIFGRQLAELIAATHRQHGVDWRLGRKVDRVIEDSVLLDDGTLLDADLVVVGIGVAPRIGLAQAAGVASADGVLVDEHLATSVPDIFAAGDIASWPDRYSGSRVRVEHWVVAERQGQVAALNMMGHRQSYDAVPFFWTKHFDLSIRYVGHAESWDELTVEGDLAGRDGLVRFVKEGRLLAVATVERDMTALQEERAWELAAGQRIIAKASHNV
jgi:hypothetical protein